MTGAGTAAWSDKRKLGCGNEQLLAEVQKLREAIADTWAETQLNSWAALPAPTQIVYENEVAVLMGSNTEFIEREAHDGRLGWMSSVFTYLKKDSGQGAKAHPTHSGRTFTTVGQERLLFLQPLGARRRRTLRFVSFHGQAGVVGAIHRRNRSDQILNTTLTWLNHLNSSKSSGTTATSFAMMACRTAITSSS